MSVCVTGDVVLGQHAGACVDDSCRGCVPREATHGLLCARHRARLGAAVTLAPALVRHIRAYGLVPGGYHGGDRIRKTKGDPPTPIQVAAVDAADRVVAELSAWAHTAATDLGLIPPVVPGWRTHGSRGAVVGLRVASTGDEAVTLARWLHIHLDQVVEHPWVGEMVEGDEAFVTVVHRTARAWPLEDHPTRLATPCPDCRRYSLYRHPPAYEGFPETYACDQVDCAAVLLPEEVPVATRLALWRARIGGDTA